MLNYLIPAPGCPRGYTGAGGISDGGSYNNCSGGMAAFLDRKLFGISHLYRYGGFKNLYRVGILKCLFQFRNLKNIKNWSVSEILFFTRLNFRWQIGLVSKLEIPNYREKSNITNFEYSKETF